MEDRQDQLSREFWEAFARGTPHGRSDGTGCLDALTLAELVDGRLTEEKRSTVEGHLASCGLCLRAVREARATVVAMHAGIVDTEDRPTPAMLASAKLLVRDVAAIRLAQEKRLATGGSFVRARWRWTEWVAGAAAGIAVSFVAFHIGSGVTAQSVVVSEEELTARMTFGLVENSGGTDTAMSLFTLTEQGEGSR